jgi:16S rRNA (cytosine967-C5)-methyltransferase
LTSAMGDQIEKESTKPRLFAIRALERIFKMSAYAEVVLDHGFRQHSFSVQDRSLITELVMGTLRWAGRLDWILKQTYAGEWERIPETIRRNLEIALYQILYTDKIPVYAAVNEAVELAKEGGGEIWGRRVNGVLRECIRRHQDYSFPSIEENLGESISIEWSHPLWFVQKMLESRGIEKTVAVCRANNERPRLSIRINRLKADKDEVCESLKREGIEAKEARLLDEFLIVSRLGDLLRTKMFKQGWFSVQDVSAGLVSHLVDPQPGERILELAAAPGGKTTHMAEISKDGAHLFAADVNPKRLRRLVQNQKRLGLQFIYPVAADGLEMRFGLFDKVLLDAPCSGSGVMRKHPEIRWQRTPEQIANLTKIQKNLLEAAHRQVRKEGILVYSTCSVLPEENSDIISDFLRKHVKYEIDHAGRFIDESVITKKGWIETWSDVHNTDGSFAVRLKKGD